MFPVGTYLGRKAAVSEGRGRLCRSRSSKIAIGYRTAKGRMVEKDITKGRGLKDILGLIVVLASCWGGSTTDLNIGEEWEPRPLSAALRSVAGTLDKPSVRQSIQSPKPSSVAARCTTTPSYTFQGPPRIQTLLSLGSLLTV